MGCKKGQHVTSILEVVAAAKCDAKSSLNND